ncbi:integral membrane protein [Xylariales sp. PMI_506]|nr:integral membrane protein [Xylariales sp. PMI_506]
MADSLGSTVNGVAIAFGVLAFVVITLRVWARVFLVNHFGPDDILICIAVLLSWAFMTVTIISVKHGLGSHIGVVEALGTQNFITYMQVVWLSSIFYNACLGFIKISVLSLYMRLGDRLLRRLAIVMIGVVACQAGGNVLACIFQCSPISAAYDITITADEKKCVDINAFYLANAAVNIFTDLLTYTLPINLIIHLQIPKSQKIGLAVILCLGLFACVSSIIRITMIPQMLVDPDATYVIAPAMYWSVIEINIGILASSIPSFKPIASKYAPRLLGSSYQKSSYNKNTGVQSRGHTKSVMELHSMDRSDRFGMGVGANTTEIKKGSKIQEGDNSSEEVLYLPPDGHISVKTQIETHFAQR